MERVRSLVSIALDRAAHTQLLGHLALHDTLTDLPNRALAVERLDAALARIGDGRAMVAVLFFDLDRFKVVNDGFGHDTGDELLVAVGRRLAAAIRRDDTVARFGGDEFVVVCENLTELVQVEEVAERAHRGAQSAVCARARRGRRHREPRHRDHAARHRSRREPPARRGRRDVPRQEPRRRTLRVVRPGDAHPSGRASPHRAGTP